VQNVVLYDLSWYFSIDVRANSPVPGLPGQVKETFWELLEEIFKYIDPEAVEDFRVIGVSPEIRRALLIGVLGRAIKPAAGYLDQLDQHQQVVRLRYFHGSDCPVEEIRVRGRVVEPLLAKCRPISYFDRVLMHERIVWLRARGRPSVWVNGRSLPFELGEPRLSRFTFEPNAIWQELAHQVPPFRAESAPASVVWDREWRELSAALTGEGHEPSVGDEQTAARPVLRAESATPPGAADRLARVVTQAASWHRSARSQPYTRRVARFSGRRRSARSSAGTESNRSPYSESWLLMDRDTNAQDNAEHLYRYLRAEQPHINAWFVLSTDSPDWARLQKDGFRLIAHRSDQHRAALAECHHVISSQIDHYVTSPLNERPLAQRSWSYTFLQHGVTHNDLSRWINHKPINLMIAATPDEHRNFVATGTPYRYTEKEVKLTGFPRHDRLLALAKAQRGKRQRTILIMPTWRRELLGEPVAGGNERELRTGFWDSEYARSWRTLLQSDQLRCAVKEFGWKVTFVPHLNMQGYMASCPSLPSFVSVRRFDSMDIQKLLVSGGIFVTDYSSLAFEMAYIQRPVIYFQFDRPTFWNGMHAFRRGRWSYEDQGFGPVVEGAHDAADAILGAVVRNGSPEREYAARMESTFPFRDGECSRRTYEAIARLRHPLQARDIYRPVEVRSVPPARQSPEQPGSDVLNSLEPTV
jgi:CDP-glycerol glycerophosphotransferase (TagB/SpsB family)